MNNERIVYILEYLQKNTDSKRYVTVKDIISHLSGTYDMSSVSVLTIRRDIESLTSAGYDIKCKTGEHGTYYYSFNSKGFTFNEIRFLVDSVSINKFLSDSQKHRLIKKFEGMCSDDDITRLMSRVRLNSKASPSLDLLKNLEALHIAISENRYVNFDYGKHTVSQKMDYYQKKRQIVPVTVVYVNERFYLRCYDELKEDMRTYRVDRIDNVKLGKKAANHYKDTQPEGFVADMFPPEYYENVTLKVKRYLYDEMLDQLGKDIFVRDDFDDKESVIIRFKAGINKQFFLWLMRYGDGLEIIKPQKERERFKKELCNVINKYSDI